MAKGSIDYHNKEEVFYPLRMNTYTDLSNEKILKLNLTNLGQDQWIAVPKESESTPFQIQTSPEHHGSEQNNTCLMDLRTTAYLHLNIGSTIR